MALGRQEGTAEPTYPAQRLQTAHMSRLGKAGKEPYDYSDTNWSLVPAFFDRIDVPAEARFYLCIPSVNSEAVNVAPGICRVYIKEMAAYYRAGTAASSSCQTLKEAFWPACPEKNVAFMYQQYIIFTNKDKLYANKSPKADLFYLL